MELGSPIQQFAMGNVEEVTMARVTRFETGMKVRKMKELGIRSVSEIQTQIETGKRT